MNKSMGLFMKKGGEGESIGWEWPMEERENGVQVQECRV